MCDEEKVSLDDRQHKEMLFFAEGTLQDIRNTKDIQRQGAIGAISLLGALLALAEKLKLHNPSFCSKLVLCAFAIVVGIGGIVYVRKQQKSLVDFRGRMKRIYNRHFILNFEPITGRIKTHEDLKKFSPWGDLVPLWTTLIIAATIIIVIWIYFTT